MPFFISEPKSQVGVNIGLVFDGSLSEDGVMKFKDFGKKLVDSFEVSEEGARFSLMSFGFRPSLESKFKDELDGEKTKEKIDGMKRQFGVARMDKALKDAADTMFSEENVGKRSSLPKILVLLTSDGAQSYGPELDKAVESLKNADIKPLVVVIGDGLEDEVKKIAPKEEDVLRLDDVDELSATKDPLVERVLANAKGKGNRSGNCSLLAEIFF